MNLWLNVWRRDDGKLMPGNHLYQTKPEAITAAIHEKRTNAHHVGAHAVVLSGGTR